MKRLFSIFLSVLILLSSSGLTYASHFCLGHNMLSKVTLGEQPLSCGMAMDFAGCGDEDEESHGCCSNRYLEVETDDHFAKASFDISFDLPWAVQPRLNDPGQNWVLEDKPVLTVCRYRPPPLPERDLLVWNQTFLI